MKSYVYLGVTRDESAAVLDIGWEDGAREPAAHALRLLGEHHSCDRVEVWRGEERIAMISRDIAGHAP